MLSEDKMIHIVHLVLDGLAREGLAEIPNKEEATREAKKIMFKLVTQIGAVGELARNRIRSQKNPPPEHSPQWDNLYNKYYEEEMRKKGG